MKHITAGRFLTLLSALFAAFLLISCEKEEDKSVQQTDREDILLTKAQEEIVKQSNTFAVNLTREMFLLQNDKENLCISPLSASLAVSALSCGAKGSTLDQIKSTLGFTPFSPEEMIDYFKYLIPQLKKVDPLVDFRSANSVWVRKGFSIEKQFVSLLDECYSSKVTELDFDSKSAVNTINKWCSDNTEGLIPQIIYEIDRSTQMLLLNALYFKGKWKTPFNEASSLKGTFLRNDGNGKSVTYMNNTFNVRYGEAEDVQVAALPYGNGAYEMVIVLPKGYSMAKSILSELTSDQWNSWMENLSAEPMTCKVKLPKFTIEYESQDAMTYALQSMGMVDPFNPSVADFRGISHNNLCVSDVVQKTYMKVDESGTEAAAVTWAGLRGASLGDLQKIKEIPTFYVIHSFIYAIREVSTGAILFMGTVNDI